MPRQFIKRIKNKQVFPLELALINTHTHTFTHNIQPRAELNLLRHPKNPFQKTAVDSIFNSIMESNPKWKRKITPEVGN